MEPSGGKELMHSAVDVLIVAGKSCFIRDSIRCDERTTLD